MIIRLFQGSKNRKGLICLLLLCFQQFVPASEINLDRVMSNEILQSVSLEDDQYALVPYAFGFAILTPAGYFNAEGKFSTYTIPFPEELNEIELRTLTATTLQGITYLLYPGGGQLYSFYRGAVQRIDASFPHRNYHDGHLFSHDNSLYLLGGYGLWTTKKDLLRYDFSSNQWEKEPTLGALPENGVWGISAVQTEDAIFIINSSYVATHDQKNRVNKKIYRLDLSSKVWTQSFELDEQTASYLTNRRRYGVQIGHEWVVFPTDARQEYVAIDPIAGEMKTRKSLDFSASTRLPLFLDGQWISLRRKKLSSPKSELVIQNYPKRDYDTVIALKTEADNRAKLTLWLVGVLGFIILLWRFTYGTKTFTLDNSTIRRRLNSISLNKGEVFFLQQLAKYGYAKNNELVHFFSEEGKTQDLFVKRKNNMLKELDAKFKAHFKKTIFTKTVDPTDQRHSIYTIAPRIIIHYKR